MKLHQLYCNTRFSRPFNLFVANSKEDLKKQTAIRLAQEQQKKGRKGSTIEHSIETSGSEIESQLKLTPPELVDNKNVFKTHHAPPIPQQSQPTYEAEKLEPEMPSIREPNLQREEIIPVDIAPASLSSSSFDSSNHKGKKGSKSKLPHGLTVQELKQMTKARLESEVSTDGVLVEDYVAPVPPSLLALPEYRDQGMSRSLQQSSPIPNGYRGMFSPEVFGYSTAARDALETASVSTATSEIHASESVYSGVHGPDSGLGSITFSRSGSYPRNNQSYDWHSNQQQQIDLTPPSFVNNSGVVYFDRTGYVPNRRRAATLSPRPGGVGMSHQDRSIYENQGVPFVHSLSSVPPGTNSLQPHVNYPDMNAAVNSGRMFPSVDIYKASEELNNNLFGGNRIRTSSCVSVLSGISHNEVELLSVDSRFAGENSSRNPFDTKLDRAHSSSVTGLSSVFRGSLENSDLDPKFSNAPARKRAETDCLPIQSGLFANEDCYSRVPEVPSDSRMRAATWGEPSLRMFGGFSLFGSETNETGLDDRLADDLASILKLSGVEQKDSLFPPPGF